MAEWEKRERRSPSHSFTPAGAELAAIFDKSTFHPIAERSKRGHASK